MTRDPIIITHLLVERNDTSFLTACGVEGVPLTPSQRFSDNETRSEGRLPGCSGNALVGETAETFCFPRQRTHFCGRCMNQFFTKGVMGMFTPQTLAKNKAEEGQ